MLAYTGIVLSPLILLAILRPLTDHSFVYTIGKNLALVGFAIFAMQFVVSARIRWIERPFGLNLLFSFHKTMAVVASLLVLSHPLLLILGGGKPSSPKSNVVLARSTELDSMTSSACRNGTCRWSLA